jgi:hypothetical protein
VPLTEVAHISPTTTTTTIFIIGRLSDLGLFRLLWVSGSGQVSILDLGTIPDLAGLAHLLESITDGDLHFSEFRMVGDGTRVGDGIEAGTLVGDGMLVLADSVVVRGDTALFTILFGDLAIILCFSIPTLETVGVGVRLMLGVEDGMEIL